MLKEKLIQLSKEIGFDLIGFCGPEIEAPVKESLHEWVESGLVADMDWMKNTEKVRTHPEELLKGVRTIIPVAFSYLHDKKADQPEPGKGIVARYARSRDYHKVVPKKMKEFCKKTQQLFDQEGLADEKITFTCDTKPLLEKYFAWKAGLGFIGRNTLLITKKHGSFVFLGTFLTTAFIEPDEPDKRTCGTCRACIDQCPTDALVDNKKLDATKCIAYWTIEHRGEFPKHVPPMLGSRMFGCDICQEVCPWNQKALEMRHEELIQKIPAQLPLREVLTIPSKEEFLQQFGGTPLMRAGFEGLKRNARAIEKNQENNDLHH